MSADTAARLRLGWVRMVARNDVRKRPLTRWHLVTLNGSRSEPGRMALCSHGEATDDVRWLRASDGLGERRDDATCTRCLKFVVPGQAASLAEFVVDP